MNSGVRPPLRGRGRSDYDRGGRSPETGHNSWSRDGDRSYDRSNGYWQGSRVSSVSPPPSTSSASVPTGNTRNRDRERSSERERDRDRYYDRNGSGRYSPGPSRRAGYSRRSSRSPSPGSYHSPSSHYSGSPPLHSHSTRRRSHSRSRTPPGYGRRARSPVSSRRIRSRSPYGRSSISSLHSRTSRESSPGARRSPIDAGSGSWSERDRDRERSTYNTSASGIPMGGPVRRESGYFSQQSATSTISGHSPSVAQPSSSATGQRMYSRQFSSGSVSNINTTRASSTVSTQQGTTLSAAMAEGVQAPASGVGNAPPTAPKAMINTHGMNSTGTPLRPPYGSVRRYSSYGQDHYGTHSHFQTSPTQQSQSQQSQQQSQQSIQQQSPQQIQSPQPTQIPFAIPSLCPEIDKELARLQREYAKLEEHDKDLQVKKRLALATWDRLDKDVSRECFRVEVSEQQLEAFDY
ncbi:hypothetical protein V1511DRAFT_154518 [Dipodascopsis uninucleata]